MQDTNFNIFLKILLKIKGLHIKNIHRMRIFIEAICYISKNGCQWRLLPFYYGNWRAIHKRFKQWSEKIFGILYLNLFRLMLIWNMQ